MCLVKTLLFRLKKTEEKKQMSKLHCWIHWQSQASAACLHRSHKIFIQTNTSLAYTAVKSCKSNGTYFIKMVQIQSMYVKRLTFWLKCNVFSTLKCTKKIRWTSKARKDKFPWICISLMNGWELKLVRANCISNCIGNGWTLSKDSKWKSK